MNYDKDKWYLFETLNKGFAIVRCGSNGLLSESMPSFEYYYNNGHGSLCQENDMSFWNVSYCKGLATLEQIEQCLKAYAEKNGYVEGVSLKDINGVKGLTVEYPLVYIAEDDCLHIGGAWSFKGALYYKGKWAEIVKDHIADPSKMITAGIFDTDESFEVKPSGGIIPIKEDDFERSGVTTRETFLRKQSVTINGENIAIQKLIDVYKEILRIKAMMG